MANKKKKRKNKPKYFNILKTTILLALIGILTTFCVVYVRQEITLTRQEKQINEMKEQNSKLEEEYQQKLKEVDDQNTIEFIDNYMRTHFGMVQDGQIRVDVTEESN